MKREKQLVKNTIIVAMGKISTQFISFLLLPLYTAVLSTKQYGVVDLLNTYIALLIPLVFLQMNQSIFRHLIDVREKEEEKKTLISTCLCTVIVQAILYLIVFSIVALFIKNEYKFFLATNVVAAMFSDIMLQISRGLGDNKAYSIGSIISGTGTIILNVLFIVVFKWGAYGMLIATFIANLLCSLFIFFRKRIYNYFKIRWFDKKTLKMLWKYSIPLVPNQLSWWIINASDRTIVTYVLGVSINGIYSAANKFSAICTALFGIFTLTWTESASLHVKDQDSSSFFTEIFNITLKIFISLCLMIIAVMPFLFKFLITGKGFANAYYQIPILLIATIFNIVVSFIGAVYVALKKSGEIAKTSIYSAIINIVINLVLIKFIGLYAASISTLVAFLSMAIYRYFDIQKYVKIRIKRKLLFLSLAMITFILCTYYLRNIYLNIVGLILVTVFSFYNNYELLLNTFKVINNRLKKKHN